MFDRITETFVEIDDFCKCFFSQWRDYLLSTGRSNRPGPTVCLSESEIMTILVLYHSSNFKHFKNFYNGIVRNVLRHDFPTAPSYQRFIELKPRVLVPLSCFMHSKMGQKTGIYYIDSTPLPVCHNLRISRHKTFEGLAAKGKSSTGWFFGFKLHLVFNNEWEIVAMKLTAGNVHDTKPVPELTKELIGKVFGDKGYLGKKLVEELLKRGLHMMTRVRKNMKSFPMNVADKMMLNARGMAETIIGHIKEFSSLNIPKHRSPTNAIVSLCAAITAYQLKPIHKKNYYALDC